MPIYVRDKINIHEGENKFTLDTVKAKGKIESININPTNETFENSTINTFLHDGSTNNQTTHSITFENDTLCDILIVGGGGGGGGRHGAGGGAGGLIYLQNETLLANTTYTIKVGKGGGGGSTSGSAGGNGNDSIFHTYTAIGGGGGASYDNGTPKNGGSGGGDARSGPGLGTSGQGNDGGKRSGTNYNHGGGGGAGSKGQDGSSNKSGDGGEGLELDITGTSTYYAGGGGGGSHDPAGAQGLGGNGGGGNGGLPGGKNRGEDGEQNTGGGGGGSSVNSSTGGGGGNGGSGIVIIKRYTKKTYTNTIKEYFNYTGSYVTWNVPSNINEITAYVWGAGGGGMGYGSRTRTSIGGTGGFVKAKIDVSNIDSLNLIVAGGGVGRTSTGAIRAGGYLSGGDSTATNYHLGGSGGGLCGIFKNDSNFTITNGELNANAYSYIIAGSGGGAGDNGSSGTAGAGNGGGGGSGTNFINGRRGGDRKQNNSLLANTGGDDGTNSTFKYSGGDGAYGAGSGAGYYGGNYDTDNENIGLPGGGGGSSYWGGENVKYIGDIPGINGSITQPDYSELVLFSIDSNIAVGASTSTLNAGNGLIILEYNDNHVVGSVYKSQTNITEYTTLDCDTTNLVAHYKFDDSTNVGLDSSGNGYDLTAKDGTVQLSSTEYVFGTSSYYTSDSLETTHFTFNNTAFSVAFWAYQTDYGYMLSQMKAGTSNQHLHIGSESDNSGRYKFGFYSNDLIATGYSGDLNQWVHLVFQIDSSKNREIWRNGVRIANDTSAAFLNLDAAGTNEIIIGTRAQSTEWFDGYLDDFRIYDKALSTSEIYYLANNMIVDPEYKALTFKYNNDYITDKQSKAQKVTGVNGWKLVRHLPSGTSQYYSGNDNFTGTFKLNELTKKIDEEWSTGYDINNDEILFIRGDFTEWLRINRIDTSLINTWIDRTSIATNYGTGTSYRYFNDGRTSAPWFYSQATYTETKILFHEDVNSGGHGSGLNGDSFDMFVRNTKSDYTSSQLNYQLTFNQPVLCDILIVGGGGASGASGSSYEPGGGGGGGIVYMENKELYGTYNIYVGKGGEDGKSGHDSKIVSNNQLVVFDDISLIGYGGGNGDTYASSTSYYTYGYPSTSGGSGGGGSHSNPGNKGIQGNTFWDGTQYVSGGNDGGPQNPSGYSGNNGSGGGGAGAAATGRDGGNGRQVDITGALLYYGGGGAGGGGGGTGSGGLGGGGDASSSSGTAGKPGEPHTGGGGGAPYGPSSSRPATASQPGGSGIVIIRYKASTSELNYDAQWKHKSNDSSVYFYGNVGIGNNANNYKLNIDGDINISGEYYKNNNSISLTNWKTNSTDIYRENGNVGIDNPNPVYKLQVNGEVYAAQGGVTGDGTTTWSVNSDRRIKDNIEIASYKECYENLKKMNLFKFNYKDGYNTSQDINQLGFIAQEIETQYPKSINTLDNIKRLNVSQINYNLFGAMKYLINEIEDLKTLTNANTSNISLEPDV